MFDDNVCTGVICLCPIKKCFIACIYRPPNASKDSFGSLLNFLSSFIDKHNVSNTFQVFLSGDFNFPNISWADLTIDSSKSISVLREDLLTFMDKHF